jgi:hypothetical protein
VGRCAFALCFLLLLPGCAGGSGEAASSAAKGPATADTPAAQELSGVRKRLQGTWEIVRYKSDARIPDEAMPLMADLFESLRIRFEPDATVVRTSKTDEERSAFLIEDESGDAFKLKTNGGMFDGASCKFLGPDAWEVTDRGKTWPGVSVLKRAKR